MVKVILIALLAFSSGSLFLYCMIRSPANSKKDANKFRLLGHVANILLAFAVILVLKSVALVMALAACIWLAVMDEKIYRAYDFSAVSKNLAEK